jgi:outer membrane lipoprotein-sorting protein
LLSGWLAAQTNLHAWSADLTQTRTLKTIAQPLTSTGRVWFAAPNRFRWELGNPPSTLAVRDADRMLVIYPRLRRAERYPLDDEARGPWKDMLSLLEAGFPRDRAALEKQFKVLSRAVSNGVCEVALQPRAAAARRFMPEVRVTFATNDFALRATQLRFADGSRMRNEFRDARRNPPLEESLFRPVLGEGYEIIEPLPR